MALCSSLLCSCVSETESLDFKANTIKGLGIKGASVGHFILMKCRSQWCAHCSILCRKGCAEENALSVRVFYPLEWSGCNVMNLLEF